MKIKMSLFVVMALAAVMALGGNVLASDAQEPTQDVVVEQGQAVVEEGKEAATEEAAQITEEATKEGEQAAEEMKEEVKEEAMENAPQGDK